MPQRRTTQLERWMIACVVALMCLVQADLTSVFAVDSDSLRSVARDSRSPITITLNGTLAANTVLSASIEGAGPPGPDGDPPFAISVHLNGWSQGAPQVSYDPETQAWTMNWLIPIGQTGARCSVAVVTPTDCCISPFVVR